MAVNDEILRALGRVTVNFQFLESNISHAAALLISPDQRVGHIVTQHLSFNRLCDVFGCLVNHRTRDEAAREEFSGLLKKALQLEHRRNEFMHANWTSDPEPARSAYRLKDSMDRKKGSKLVIEELTPEAVNQVADEMGEVANELVRALGKLLT